MRLNETVTRLNRSLLESGQVIWKKRQPIDAWKKDQVERGIDLMEVNVFENRQYRRTRSFGRRLSAAKIQSTTQIAAHVANERETRASIINHGDAVTSYRGM